MKKIGNNLNELNSKKIWNYIIAILLILGGIYLIFEPVNASSNLVFYIGLILTIIGVFKVLSSIINKENFLLPGNFLFNGILNTLFGIILMTNSTTTLKIISTIIGIWLIISATSGLALLFNLKNNKNTINNNLLVSYILKLIIGIIVLATPIITIILTGWVLGIILVLIGVYMIVNSLSKKSTYSVKIK